MGPALLPVTTTSPALLLPIRKGTVSHQYISFRCLSETFQINRGFGEKQNWNPYDENVKNHKWSVMRGEQAPHGCPFPPDLKTHTLPIPYSYGPAG